jgi:hypothetical protein
MPEGDWPTVMVHDPVTGEKQESPLPPDEYIVLTGRDRYVDGVQMYGNGTVVVTIKRDHPKEAAA